MINIGNNRGVFRSVSKICEKAPSYLFDRVLKTFLNKDPITMPLEVVLLFSLSTASTFCVNFLMYRSSHHQCSIKKLFLKIFFIFAERQLYQSFFFNQAAGQTFVILLNNETMMHVFSCEYCETCETLFLQSTFEGLLLDSVKY